MELEAAARSGSGAYGVPMHVAHLQTRDSNQTKLKYARPLARMVTI